MSGKQSNAQAPPPLPPPPPEPSLQPIPQQPSKSPAQQPSKPPSQQPSKPPSQQPAKPSAKTPSKSPSQPLAKPPAKPPAQQSPKSSPQQQPPKSPPKSSSQQPPKLPQQQQLPKSPPQQQPPKSPLQAQPPQQETPKSTPQQQLPKSPTQQESPKSPSQQQPPKSPSQQPPKSPPEQQPPKSPPQQQPKSPPQQESPKSTPQQQLPKSPPEQQPPKSPPQQQPKSPPQQESPKSTPQQQLPKSPPEQQPPKSPPQQQPKSLPQQESPKSTPQQQLPKSPPQQESPKSPPQQTPKSPSQQQPSKPPSQATPEEIIQTIMKDKEESLAKATVEELLQNFFQDNKLIDLVTSTAAESDVKQENEKCPYKASVLKEQGNKLYQKQEWKGALKVYNDSVIYAPQNPTRGVPSCMAVSYANRSAVLYQLEEYDECVNDCLRALASGYPHELKYKLYRRLGESYLKLNKFNDSLLFVNKGKEWLRGVENLPKEKKDQMTKDLDHLTSDIDRVKKGESPLSLNNKVQKVLLPFKRIEKDEHKGDENKESDKPKKAKKPKTDDDKKKEKKAKEDKKANKGGVKKDESGQVEDKNKDSNKKDRKNKDNKTEDGNVKKNNDGVDGNKDKDDPTAKKDKEAPGAKADIDKSSAKKDKNDPKANKDKNDIKTKKDTSEPSAKDKADPNAKTDKVVPDVNKSKDDVNAQKGKNDSSKKSKDDSNARKGKDDPKAEKGKNDPKTKTAGKENPKADKSKGEPNADQGKDDRNAKKSKDDSSKADKNKDASSTKDKSDANVKKNVEPKAKKNEPCKKASKEGGKKDGDSKSGKNVSKYNKPNNILERKTFVSSKHLALDNLKFAYKKNSNISSLSSAAKVELNPKKGRCVVACKDLKVGDVVLMERPYFSMLLPEFGEDHCWYCMAQLLIAIPCTECCQVRYCSEKCRDDAWMKFHRVECGYVVSLVEKGYGFSLLCLRMILTADPDSILNFEGQLDELKSPHKVPGFDEKNIFGTSRYYSVYSLMSHQEHLDFQTKKDIAVSAIFALKWLESNRSKVGTQKSVEDATPAKADTVPQSPTNKLETASKTDAKIESEVSADKSGNNKPGELAPGKKDNKKQGPAVSNKKDDTENKKGEQATTPVEPGTKPEEVTVESKTDQAKTEHKKPKVPTKEKKAVTVPKVQKKREIFSPEETLRLTSAISKHLLQVKCNGGSISEFYQDVPMETAPVVKLRDRSVGIVLHPVYSLFNHDCDPNLGTDTVGNLIVCRAIRNIKAGEELCICYGASRFEQRRQERQKRLLGSYCFTCDCKACKADYAGEMDFAVMKNTLKTEAATNKTTVGALMTNKIQSLTEALKMHSAASMQIEIGQGTDMWISLDVLGDCMTTALECCDDPKTHFTGIFWRTHDQLQLCLERLTGTSNDPKYAKESAITQVKSCDKAQLGKLWLLLKKGITSVSGIDVASGRQADILCNNIMDYACVLVSITKQRPDVAKDSEWRLLAGIVSDAVDEVRCVKEARVCVSDIYLKHVREVSNNLSRLYADKPLQEDTRLATEEDIKEI